MNNAKWTKTFFVVSFSPLLLFPVQFHFFQNQDQNTIKTKLELFKLTKTKLKQKEK